ncbi:YhcB family protein [Thalassotalea sp. ND16A]|uniref:YhcB family protein n=1 Tax=Thalassotalea sp. ND16A TaxID=1535422 RepID=UPI00051A58EF|nr:DUF1043 family protein [Thalassotalea sp. ND16A]KGJ98977.1 hypothetical protein ND16A_0499 [Thalassotalea sp. ND16A]
MEFLYLFIGAVIGTIGGFFISNKMSASEQDYKRLEQEASANKTSLKNYQQEVATHLASSAQLLNQMNETCATAMAQMEKSTILLHKATNETKAMPFFSEEIEAQMRTSPDKLKAAQPRKKEQITEAPRDYSADPSGLFNDEKQVVTNSPS